MNAPKDLIGKCVRIKGHILAPAAMVGFEGVVVDVRELEPHDDDIAQVRLSDGREVFVPVDAIEVVAP